MFYMTREAGKYFLRPLTPERSHEKTEITEAQFYERWRRTPTIHTEHDIAAARSLPSEHDFDVL